MTGFLDLLEVVLLIGGAVYLIAWLVDEKRHETVEEQPLLSHVRLVPQERPRGVLYDQDAPDQAEAS